MPFHTFCSELVEQQYGVSEHVIEDLFFVHTLLGTVHTETPACRLCESNDGPLKNYSEKRFYNVSLNLYFDKILLTCLYNKRCI